MAATVTYEKILIVTISFRLMRKISKNVGEYIKSVKMLGKLKEIIIRLNKFAFKCETKDVEDV